MQHLVYKITNRINSKCYIGVHSTKNPRDGYMGSGTLIRRAINQYGVSAFSKEILYSFRTRKEALDKEAEIVCRHFLETADTYNLIPGGGGWPVLPVKEAIDPNAFAPYDENTFYEFYQVTPSCQVPHPLNSQKLKDALSFLWTSYDPLRELSRIYNNKYTNKKADEYLAIFWPYEAYYNNIAVRKAKWQDHENMMMPMKWIRPQESTC